MSAIFNLDRDEPSAHHEDETWNPSRGVFTWAVEVIAENAAVHHMIDELVGMADRWAGVTA